MSSVRAARMRLDPSRVTAPAGDQRSHCFGVLRRRAVGLYAELRNMWRPSDNGLITVRRWRSATNHSTIDCPATDE